MTPIPALPITTLQVMIRIKDRRYQATKEQQPSPKHERGKRVAEKLS